MSHEFASSDSIILSREEHGYRLVVRETETSYETTAYRISDGKRVPCFPLKDSVVGAMADIQLKMTKKQAKQEMRKLARESTKKMSGNMSRKNLKKARSETTKIMLQESGLANPRETAIRKAGSFPMELFSNEDRIAYCWKQSEYGIKGMLLTQDQIDNGVTNVDDEEEVEPVEL